MSNDLFSKTAVITGGTGALGTAVTAAFVNSGAKVVVTYIIEDERKKVEQAIQNANCTFEKVDLFSNAEVISLFERVKKTHGRLDSLVCLAGGFAGGHTVEETPETEWEKMFTLNCKSAYYCIQQAMPLLKQNGGSIITMGSTLGFKGGGNFSAYGASKAALINLTQAAAEEGKKHHVRANVVVPSTIDTEANRASMPKADFSKWVKPESLAQTILFLSSEASKDISGATIPVYGGV